MPSAISTARRSEAFVVVAKKNNPPPSLLFLPLSFSFSCFRLLKIVNKTNLPKDFPEAYEIKINRFYWFISELIY